MKKDRVIVYVDGFNLYYGLKDSGLRRYYWLDIQKLAKNLLKPNQRLVAVRYFTTRLKETPASATKSQLRFAFMLSKKIPSGRSSQEADVVSFVEFVDIAARAAYYTQV